MDGPFDSGGTELRPRGSSVGPFLAGMGTARCWTTAGSSPLSTECCRARSAASSIVFSPAEPFAAQACWFCADRHPQDHRRMEEAPLTPGVGCDTPAFSGTFTGGPVGPGDVPARSWNRFPSTEGACRASGLGVHVSPSRPPRAPSTGVGLEGRPPGVIAEVGASALGPSARVGPAPMGAHWRRWTPARSGSTTSGSTGRSPRTRTHDAVWRSRSVPTH